MEQQLFIISECLASSSSSISSDESSSGGEFFEIENLLKKSERHSVKDFVEEVVAYYSDEEFRRHFRVSRETAASLIGKFERSIYYKRKSNGAGRKAVNARSQMLAFLWFAGNKESYREISNLFNMSISSAYRSQSMVMEFFFHISTEYIKMPSTRAEKERKSSEFAELAGFEDVIGCIDGSFIYIRCPAHKIRSTYVNRHGLLSITLQGICDANKKFLDVFVGATSKIHDSRIFNLSHISKDIPRICGRKYHLLGDAAYPLREFLLTPYRDYGDLTVQQKKYNKKHCQTRVRIENSFGLLKQRWRQLMRLDFFTVMRMSKFVISCCVLHNMCIDYGDEWPDEDIEEEEGENNYVYDNDSLMDAILLLRGQVKRSTIVESL